MEEVVVVEDVLVEEDVVVEEDKEEEELGGLVIGMDGVDTGGVDGKLCGGGEGCVIIGDD